MNHEQFTENNGDTFEIEDGFHVDLTLAELRDADAVRRAEMRREQPHMFRPLGLVGTYEIETTVMDSDVDYTFGSYEHSFTSEIAAWDVMCALADEWADCKVMDDFVFASLYVVNSTRPDLLSVILFAEGDLSDEQLDAMPFED